MSVRVNYDLVIKDIEKNFNGRYEITQHVAKRVGNGEFPKSLFNKSYINQEKNALARYIKENYDGYKIVYFDENGKEITDKITSNENKTEPYIPNN